MISSNHESAVQFLQMIKYWFEADGENSGLELIFPCDPEFTLQGLKFTTILPELTSNIVMPPSIFHMECHGLECVRKQLVFMMLLMMLLERKIKFKPSVNNGLPKLIYKLVKDQERDAIFSGSGPANQEPEFTDEDYGLNDGEDDESNEKDKDNDNTNENDKDSENEPDHMGAENIEEAGDDEPFEIASNEYNEDEMNVLLESASNTEFDKTEKEIVERMIKTCTAIIVSVNGRRAEVAQFIIARDKAILEKKPRASKMKIPPGKILYQNILKLCKTMIVNKESMKYNSELLWAIVQDADSKQLLQQYYQKNSLCKMIHSLLHHQLRLCVEPMNAIHADGNITPLLTQFPMYARLFSFGCKPFITRAALFLIAQLIHLQKKRNDLAVQLGYICTSISDVNVEHANALIERYAVTHQSKDFQDIRNASVDISMKRHNLQELREILEIFMFFSVQFLDENILLINNLYFYD